MRISQTRLAFIFGIVLSFAPAACFVCLQGSQPAYAGIIYYTDEASFLAALGCSPTSMSCSQPLGQQNFSGPGFVANGTNGVPGYSSLGGISSQNNGGLWLVGPANYPTSPLPSNMSGNIAFGSGD